MIFIPADVDRACMIFGMLFFVTAPRIFTTAVCTGITCGSGPNSLPVYSCDSLMLRAVRTECCIGDRNICTFAKILISK